MADAFENILGQPQVREFLRATVAHDKVSHAYLFTGPAGSNKTMAAYAFAQAVLCPKGASGPRGGNCGVCDACRRIMRKKHPDVRYFAPEGAGGYLVEQIRDIVADTSMAPIQAHKKVYILDRVDLLGVQAANAFLKTLEEPPAYGVLLILTTNVEALLPTIVSRCVVLNMKPVRDDIVRKFLMEDMQIPDYKANVCVAFARGNIGRAKLLASSEDFDNVKEEAVTLLKYIHDMEISEIVAAIKKISEYKLDVTDYLDILSIWYRDVLLFKATNDANHLIFKEEIKYIRKEADQKSYEGIEIILDSLEKAKSRLSANVNFDLTMELLFLTMKEN